MASQESTGKNNIADTLQVIAWIIYIGGFIAGFVLGNVEVPYTYIPATHTEFSFTLALTYWAAFFITGTILLGFAEIIQLLQKLVDNEVLNTIKTSGGEINTDSDLYDDLPKL